MKLVALRFMNLACLKGKWEIRFDSVDFAQGIFAIVGPTGAGKSTIFDAICLALFKQTPRQGTLTESHNSILTMGQNSCFSELDFWMEGQLYRARFEQSKSKRTDHLQTPKWVFGTVDDKGNAHWVTEKVSETKAHIQNVIGMDLTQFRHSVMLSQGDFADFLIAKRDEKTKLLAKMLQDTSYEDISKAVFRRAQEAKEARDALLHTNYEDYLGARKSEVVQRGQMVAEQIDELHKAVADLGNALSAIRQLHVAKDTLADLTQRQEAMAKMLKRARRIKTAKHIAHLYTAYQNAKDAYRAYQRDMKTIQARIKEHQDDLERANAHLSAQNDALNAHQEVKNALQDAYDESQRLQNARATNAHLQNHDQAALKEATCVLKDAQSAYRDALVTLDQVQDDAPVFEEIVLPCDLADWRASWKTLQRAFDQATSEARVLVTKAGAEALNALFAQGTLQKIAHLDAAKDALKARICALDSFVQEVNVVHSQAAQARNDHLQLKTLDNQTVALQEALERAQEAYKSAQNSHQALTLDYHLSGLFDALEDGAPCPLCGALEHPKDTPHHTPVSEADYQASKAKSKDAHTAYLELRQKMDQHMHSRGALKKALKTHKTQMQSLARQARAFDINWHIEAGTLTLLDAAQVALKALREDQSLLDVAHHLPRALELSDTCRTLMDTKKTALSQLWEAMDASAKSHYRASDAAQSQIALRDAHTALLVADPLTYLQGHLARNFLDFEGVSDYLDARLEHKAHRDRARLDHQNILDKQTTKVNALQNHLNVLQHNHTAHQNKVQAHTEALAHLDAQLSALAGDVARYLEAVNALNDLSKQIQDKRQNIATKQAQIQTETEHLVRLTDTLSTHITAARTAQEAWDEAWSRAFASQEDALYYANLQSMDDILDEADVIKSDIKIQDDKVREFTSVLKALGLGVDETALNKAYQKTKDDLNGLIDERAQIRLSLEKDKAATAKMQADLKEYNRLKKNTHALELLSDLIGSANGQKFSLLAHTLTFRTLLVRADEILAHLSKRYQLVAPKEIDEHMEVFVQDSYNANAIRTSQSLSGGERFLVSLALALALSSLLGKEDKARFFFLDEGFGTLDDVTLNDALDALHLLQEDGRLIGIISHILGLKERVATQIQAIKITSHESRLEGAGVRALGAS